jgi:O-antigen/teichoic acid export membrane protein
MFARLIALLAAGEAAAIKRRIKIAAIAYAAAGVSVFLAVIFLVVAGYLAAAVRLGPIEAALWFGVGFLLLAGVIYAIYRVTARARAEAGKRAESMMVGASALAMLPALGKKGGWSAVLMALAAVAGYAAYTEYERRSRRRRRRPR